MTRDSFLVFSQRNPLTPFPPTVTYKLFILFRSNLPRLKKTKLKVFFEGFTVEGSLEKSSAGILGVDRLPNGHVCPRHKWEWNIEYEKPQVQAHQYLVNRSTYSKVVNVGS